MNKLTILLSVYNGCKNESLFRNTLDSICNQTSNEYEVLIMDDTSTDDTNLIIDEYIKKYPHVRKITNETNLGMIESYNKGIRNITTKYITFITDNNELFPTFVEDMLNFAESSNIDYARAFWLKGQKLRNPYQDDNMGVCNMYNKKIFEEEGLISLDVGWGLDCDTWYKVKHHVPPYRVAVLNKILGKYHAVPNDQTTLLSREDKLIEAWRWHDRWKMRESRYIEDSDRGHTIKSKMLFWVDKIFQLYSENRPDNINIKDINKDTVIVGNHDIIISSDILKYNTEETLVILDNIISHLNHNGVFAIVIEVQKPSIVDVSACFKELNKRNITYYPESNFTYVCRERSPPVMNGTTTYLRIFGVKHD